MSKLIFFPCKGITDAHYQKTLKHPISIKDMSKILPEKQVKQLEDELTNDYAYVWGVAPSTGANSNHTNWAKINPGDIALFGTVDLLGYARVSSTMINRKLSVSLWGYKERRTGLTWEYLVFFDKLILKKWHVAEFNKLLSYDEDFYIQRFMVVEEEKSQKAIQFFGLNQ